VEEIGGGTHYAFVPSSLGARWEGTGGIPAVVKRRRKVEGRCGPGLWSWGVDDVKWWTSPA